MTTYNLEKFFEPRAIVVIGPCQQKGNCGYKVLKNLKKSGYKGPVLTVDPPGQELNGLAYKQVDLAVVVTPVKMVPKIIRACSGAGIRGAVVLSGPGTESADEYRHIEKEIGMEAQDGGVRIIGPNSLGISSAKHRINASLYNQMPLPGKLAFITQSGDICPAIIDWSLAENIGFSHFANIGSGLDVDLADLIDYFGNDHEVKSILLNITRVGNIRKFISAARAVSRVKPIVALKAGRFTAGIRVAASPISDLIDEDDLYDAAFNRAGVERVDTLEELFDCAELLARRPRPRGPGLAIITNGGGPGVMAVDELASFGLEPVSLSPKTCKRLEGILPDSWTRRNPIDISDDASPERYAQVTEVCIAASEIDALMIIFCPQAMTSPADVAAVLRDQFNGRAFPVLTVFMGGQGVEEGRQILNQAEIPAYASPERAIRAFRHMYFYHRNLKLLEEIPPRFPLDLEFDNQAAEGLISQALGIEGRMLTELESKELLRAYGIPVNQTKAAFSADEAARLAVEIGFPVVLKLPIHDFPDQLGSGRLQVDLYYESQVRPAFDLLMETAWDLAHQDRSPGVSIQSMVARSEYELVLGCKKHEQFGPVLLFGVGGIMTEALQDYALGLPPLNRLLARRVLETTEFYRMLRGNYNRTKGLISLLEELLVRLSHLVTDFPQIAELEINPMILNGDQALVMDARVMVEPSMLPSPFHLVISPYPVQYERRAVTSRGIELNIRPIKPEDAQLLARLFQTLSERSIYFRFCRLIKELPSELLARFTQIDYDREAAFVAIGANQPEEKILGVARAIFDPDGQSAELAVVVGDPWQGQGVGACLMEHCIAITIERGFKRLKAYILPENRIMRSLALKSGWTSSGVEDNYYYYEAKADLGYGESPAAE